MAILVPGVPNSAVVTYTSLRSQFPALRAGFEAHAASITGGEQGGTPILAAASRAGLIGAIVGGVVGALAGVVAWRKRRTA